ncbi:MAG: HIT domain-containing protein, partial [Xanthomonadaceae bacterium]|nr:HIT domain-containing protein [Xanthomonadaceae bacterium]
MSEDLFEKIVRREIPADVVFETEELLAFRDVNPQAPVHVLIIPKRKIRTLNDLGDDDAGLV